MATPAGADSDTTALRDHLKSSFQRANDGKVPVLTHLNADTSWLLSLAYPDQVSPPNGRSRYNILIDPWLDGPQEDVASWFSKQWHLVQSSVRTIDGLNAILCDAEGLESQTAAEAGRNGCSFIDAIVISHEFTDHCHQATLREVDRTVPVIATTKAAQLIRTWDHFDTVIEMPNFTADTNWQKTSIPPLPSWIGISRLVTNSDALYYHSAVMLCARRPNCATEAVDALIYTPHGVEASTLSVVATASPPVEVLALLHGLHDVSIKWSKQLNLGAINAVKAQKTLHAKYWIGTHDEEKGGSGLIAFLLQRKILTVREAIAQVQAAEKEKSEHASGRIEDLTCVELKNGESMVLG
ncbi:hypothetical protein A1O7_02328 [Cladophialophora yegresii CBS 114405]|uniref:Metallo-beta-lactamase domain-containing protein n=1 Tax=Cladophialophora yegresii CBS 114405 TaxID=1182544 RepID=W9W1F8_9EURO|nr:uncharacterized protein A1O7_02328 [Cladophialophora yegresii CBS 114405]EXJ61897.1 hypothetical protein A1O7_02328 [Cladophialophora yegresii CBS 114405]